MACHPSQSLISAFQTHYDELLRFLTRRLGNVAWAEDVVQETYLRLASVQEATAAIKDPRAYLFRVAGNLAIDAIRKNDRIGRMTAPEESAAALADPLGSPETVLGDRQRLARLDQALAQLPPNAARALLMSRVDGLTFAQIAGRLGVSESMVAKYMTQALRACRDHLWRGDEEN